MSALVSAEVASSRMSSFGRWPIALAISTICWRDRGQIAHSRKGVNVLASYIGQQSLGPATLSAGIHHAEAPRRRGDRNIVRDRKIRHQAAFLKMQTISRRRLLATDCRIVLRRALE